MSDEVKLEIEVKANDYWLDSTDYEAYSIGIENAYTALKDALREAVELLRPSIAFSPSGSTVSAFIKKAEELLK